MRYHLLNDIVSTIQSRGLNITLRDGLNRFDINKILGTINFPLSESIYELYSWRNGQDVDARGDAFLFGEQKFLPLDMAIEEYMNLKEYYDENIDFLYNIERDKCFPFASFQNDVMCMYLSDNPVKGVLNPIFGMYYSEEMMFINLDSMIATVKDWYSFGLYDSDIDNIALRESVRKKWNPGLFRI